MIMNEIDVLFDLDKVLQEYLKDSNNNYDAYVMVDGSVKKYYRPFRIELTYQGCGNEEKHLHFYIVRSNARKGIHLLQRDAQRFGYDNTGAGMGLTDGSDRSIYGQSHTWSLSSAYFKGIRNRLNGCDEVVSRMHLENMFDTDEKKYILSEIKGGGFEDTTGHLKEESA